VTNYHNSVGAYNRWLEAEPDVEPACKKGKLWVLWAAYNKGYERGHYVFQQECREMLGLEIQEQKERIYD